MRWLKNTASWLVSFFSSPSVRRPSTSPSRLITSVQSTPPRPHYTGTCWWPEQRSSLWPCAVSLPLDKGTAGSFINALSLSVAGFTERATSKVVTAERQRGGQIETRESRRDGGRYSCGWKKGGVWVKCSLCESKVGMRYECSTEQHPPPKPCSRTKHTNTHMLYNTLSWSAWFPLQVIMIRLLFTVPGEWRSHGGTNTWYEMLRSGQPQFIWKMGWAERKKNGIVGWKQDLNCSDQAV